ncbi:hypothetical protein HPB49_009532 [Dermacentor silvarum]|uniref:Uncharacterized protein n=1 Tax=Dermacentor silvarum TaxID=543639 RepID=A0ACB8DY65_DERSI|nr:hypothetical protein HPB49_009532 [Dermacentor silvarum]
MAVPDVATHPSVAGASLSSEEQYCYQRRTRVHPPSNAFTQFAQEKRRSVAAKNVNEHNRRVSSRLAKLWRPLRGADKEPLQPKIVEAVAVHRRKYPDYAHNPREAHQRKEQERIAKQVISKLNIDSSWDMEQQPLTSTVEAQRRGGPKFQQELPSLSPTPRSKHRAIISAARVGASGADQGTVVCMPTTAVPATTKDLEEEVVPVKVVALRALAELLKRQPPHFRNYAELTLIKIFGTLKQPEKEVNCAAELCSMEAVPALHPEQTMRLLHSLIGESDDQDVVIAVIKVMCRLVEVTQRIIVEQLPQIIAASLKGYDHSESSVRKAAVFGMVTLHGVVGYELMKPQLASLTGCKRAQGNSTRSTPGFPTNTACSSGNR